MGCVLAAPPAAAAETSRRRDGRLQVVPGCTPALAAVWRGKRAMHGCWCDAPSCQPPGTAEATSVASTTSSAMDYPGVAAVHCASGFRTGAGTTPSACQVCALATQTRCCQDWHGTAQRLRVNQRAMVGRRYTHHTPIAHPSSQPPGSLANGAELHPWVGTAAASLQRLGIGGHTIGVSSHGSMEAPPNHSSSNARRKRVSTIVCAVNGHIRARVA